MHRRWVRLILGLMMLGVLVGCGDVAAPEGDAVTAPVVEEQAEAEVEVEKEVIVEVEKEVEPFSTGSEDIPAIEAAVPLDKSAEPSVQPINTTIQDEPDEAIMRVEPTATAIVAVATTVPTLAVLTPTPEPTAIVAVEPTVAATVDQSVGAVAAAVQPDLGAMVEDMQQQVGVVQQMMARLEAIFAFLNQFVGAFPAY